MSSSTPSSSSQLRAQASKLEREESLQKEQETIRLREALAIQNATNAAHFKHQTIPYLVNDHAHPALSALLRSISCLFESTSAWRDSIRMVTKEEERDVPAKGMFSSPTKEKV